MPSTSAYSLIVDSVLVLVPDLDHYGQPDMFPYLDPAFRFKFQAIHGVFYSTLL